MLEFHVRHAKPERHPLRQPAQFIEPGPHPWQIQPETGIGERQISPGLLYSQNMPEPAKAVEIEPLH